MAHHSENDILYLSRKDIERVCEELDSVAIMYEVFKMQGLGQTILPGETSLSWVNDNGESAHSLSMPAYVTGSLRTAGTKVVNRNVSNPARRLQRTNGLTLLYDDISARVACIVEGTHLSRLCTASVTVLAVDLLKGSDISCAAIIGAGPLARTHIELLVKRCPQILRIQLFDINKERVTALQRDLTPLLQTHQVVLHATATAEEAIRSAQLIIPVTTVTIGYIQFDWLQPGSLLVNVSLDDPLPEVVLKATTVVVDDWHMVRNDRKRLIGRMYREGRVFGPDERCEALSGHRRRIDAQLGELVIGKKVGRRSPKDIILMNPSGLSIEDVALAYHAYHKARSLSIGTWLER